MRLCFFRAVILAGALLPLAACGPTKLNERVLVVYARNAPRSEAIAKHYAAARHVPAANLCAVKLQDPNSRLLSNDAYQHDILTPVQACLTRAGKDKILYIVLAYIRPYIVDPGGLHSYALDSYLADPWEFYSSKPADPIPQFPHPYFANNQAKANLFVPFVSLADFRAQPAAPLIYAVWRLDGPTAEIALALVDKAIKAEGAHGPAGQACIDERVDPANYPDESYRSGDWDLHRAAQFLVAAGRHVTEDHNDAEFGTPPAGTCPNTALYAGWYKLNHYNDAFTWNEGAIGVHLDSLSALDPRSGENWSAQALLRGITITSGAVDEPYLWGLPRPGGLFHDLLAGANVGDAFLRNTRFLKWRILNFGDPLYTPFPKK